MRLTCLIVLLAACLARAQSPATQSTATDAVTPRGALRVFAAAVRAGDAAAVRRCLHAVTEAEKQLADAMASSAAAAATLRRSSGARYGEDASRRLDAESSKPGRLEAARESIDGDAAAVELPTTGPSASTVRLVRVDGLWRIPVTDLLGGEDPENVGRLVPTMRSMARIMNEVADEIAADKYRTFEAARDTMRLRLREAAAVHAVEPTAPATRPAPATGEAR